jgi:TM2 domain-containing membrane protein YozV
MNCYLHPEIPAAAYCRSCGRPVCEACRRPADGTIYCQEHLPQVDTPPMNAYQTASGPTAAAPANPYLQNAVPAVAPMQNSPGLAFVLGLLPGVGAIYNGQYLKGLVHAIIFGLLVSLVSSINNGVGEPLLGMMVFCFYCYMPFEAYHTARKRRLGVMVDEWSSLIAQPRYRTRAPIGPILLILLGVLFLLDTLRLIQFRELARFWPVLLILVGAFMLYNRVAPLPPAPSSGTNPPPPGGYPNQEYAGQNFGETHHE